MQCLLAVRSFIASVRVGAVQRPHKRAHEEGWGVGSSCILVLYFFYFAWWRLVPPHGRKYTGLRFELVGSVSGVHGVPAWQGGERHTGDQPKLAAFFDVFEHDPLLGSFYFF